MATERYIPPMLRSKAELNQQDRPEQPAHPKGGASSPSAHPCATLSASAEEPETLAYIILFDREHPYWETKREVFCNENLHLLPSSFTEPAVNTNPCPGTSAPNDNKQQYHFQHIQILANAKTPAPSTPLRATTLSALFAILEPHSRQLAWYLEMKFGTDSRNPEKWIEKFSQFWTVVTMVLDTHHEGEGGRAPPPPIVDLEAEAAAEKRTVNEILGEMWGGERGELRDFVGWCFGGD
ncbi:hypothetical protein PAAG_03797 [Paracoccidioides lutzii Pb01]|uniref:Uncharacterized protein n=1 Tax=Paracoccidioides lutzii (strain ATCC MYA-826 / Pb01) TaxID=502779 RepID=C1GZ53_PARBA|nr:hypothetical protein PAAG_03797 [Paracoccidioides lutzii Pb01]EEH41876.2 hypothetical protein PAAG_03797 [Paracoccidioides lutzii Pb01]